MADVEDERSSCDHTLPEPILTTAQKNLFIVCVLILVIIIAVGLLGNLAVCWLLSSRRSLRTCTNVQLILLGVVDIMVCAISCSIYLYGTLITLSQNMLCLDKFLVLRYFNSFVMGFNCITVALTLATMSISTALTATRNMPKEKMRSGIILSLSFSFAVGAIWGAFQAVLSGKMLPNMSHGEPYLPMMKISDIAGGVIIMVSVFTILISYIYVYIKQRMSLTVVQAFDGQASDSDNETADIVSLKTHMVMVLAFVITHIPAMIFCFIHFSSEAEMNVLYFIPLVCLYYCGSALNPCIYLATSQTYRHRFLLIIPSSKCTRS